MPPVFLLCHLQPDLFFSSKVIPYGSRMVATDPGCTLFTELHPGAEKALCSWGRGAKMGQGALHPGRKLFPRNLLDLWLLLCRVQLMAERMDLNKPLEVKDAGYCF